MTARILAAALMADPGLAAGGTAPPWYCEPWQACEGETCVRMPPLDTIRIDRQEGDLYRINDRPAERFADLATARLLVSENVLADGVEWVLVDDSRAVGIDVGLWLYRVRRTAGRATLDQTGVRLNCTGQEGP